MQLFLHDNNACFDNNTYTSQRQTETHDK